MWMHVCTAACTTLGSSTSAAGISHIMRWCLVGLLSSVLSVQHSSLPSQRYLLVLSFNMFLIFYRLCDNIVMIVENICALETVLYRFGQNLADGCQVRKKWPCGIFIGITPVVPTSNRFSEPRFLFLSSIPHIVLVISAVGFDPCCSFWL